MAVLSHKPVIILVICSQSTHNFENERKKLFYVLICLVFECLIVHHSHVQVELYPFQTELILTKASQGSNYIEQA